ncbi:head-tail connector protein [Falsirhodobacter xinxiangensis]|uniref:head-tail connector protein n=1 Tax=Falsirhodobacter xinxiangensis TaxID=2530049 RepID=UPI00145B28E9|nr:head-tail connector protein [Rhodobacter xinxiangensis]
MRQFTDIYQVKQMLRIDSDDQNLILDQLVIAASEAIAEYIKLPTEAADDDVPYQVRIATVMLVGHLLRGPDNDVEGAFETGLPAPVKSLLYPLRMLTLA